MEHLHELGIAHLDISLNNIMRVSDDSDAVKLIDFGAARCMPCNEDCQNHSPRGVVGKLEFMSPEVCWRTVSLHA